MTERSFGQTLAAAKDALAAGALFRKGKGARYPEDPSCGGDGVEVDAAEEGLDDLLCADAVDEEEEDGAWEVEQTGLAGGAAASSDQPAQSSTAAAPHQPCKMERLMALKLIYGRGPPRTTPTSTEESPAALAVGPSSAAPAPTQALGELAAAAAASS